MHPAQVNEFSFPEVTLRVLSDHYTEKLRDIVVKLWQEEKYKKEGKKDHYVATVHVPASRKAKNSLVTFHFHVAANAIVILDRVTMQFLRGSGETAHKDDAQLQLTMGDNTLLEVTFFYTTHPAGEQHPHTYTSHFEQYDLHTLLSYIDKEHRKDKKNCYHWIQIDTVPGMEELTFVSGMSLTGEKVKQRFQYVRAKKAFIGGGDILTAEDYIDSLQSLLGMLPLNLIT